MLCCNLQPPTHSPNGPSCHVCCTEALLWKSCSYGLVEAATQQMDPSSSPGDDGIQAAVYEAFPDFFA